MLQVAKFDCVNGMLKRRNATDDIDGCALKKPNNIMNVYVRARKLKMKSYLGIARYIML